MRRTRFPGVMLVGMGLFFCLLNFIVMTAFTFTERKCDAMTTGVVIDLDTYVDDGTRMYTPTIEYYVNGEMYVLYSNMSSSSYGDMLGKEVDIMYNSDDPNIASMKSPFFLNIIKWVFYITGGFMIITGAPMLIFGSKQKLTPEEEYDRRY